MNKVLLVFVACFIVGCGQPQENTAESTVETAPVFDVETSTAIEIGRDIVIDRGHLTGSLERMTDMDEHATILDGWSNSSGAAVDIIVERADSAGMVRLMFDRGGLNHEDFVVGFHQVFDYNSEVSDTELVISSIGCAGPRYSQWDYDSPASSVEILISIGPDDSKIVNFVATWDLAGDEVSGHFLIQ